MDLKEKKILIVDDEEDIREILTDSLESLDYQTCTATDGEEAIEIIKQKHDELAVIICDLKMPKVSGDQVVHYIAQSHPIIPIIILSGFAQLDMALDHIRMGAFDYMSKPFKFKELALTVKRALEFRSLKEEQKRYQETLEATIKDITAKLNSSVIQTVGSLIMAIEEKDKYTRGHSHRVAFYASMVAQTINLGNEEKKRLEYAALLHDVGKIGISEHILNKPGKLNNVEYEMIKTHPSKGVKILEPLKFLEDILPIIEAHHERYDGKGYPHGLMHEQIPMLARIICACDAYDAMTSDRSYRKPLAKEIALEEIKNGAGGQFDPTVVQAFITTYNSILSEIT